MELTNKDEQYYRVDFETAKLLKQAKFDYKCTAYYDNTGYYWGVETKSSHNRLERRYSAPLTEIVLVWLKELGYEKAYRGDGVAVFHNRMWIKKSNKETGSEREDNILFIQACCKHIIETKKN